MAASLPMLDRIRLASLAKRAAAGDARAFARLYRLLHAPVFAFVARRVAEPSDVEDLTARVFHRLVEHLPSYDPKRGSIRGWVMTMARNAVIDHCRTRRCHTSMDEAQTWLTDATLLPCASLEHDETLAAVRALVAELPSKTREIIALRFADELPHREIAQMLGMTEDAVKQRVSRVLRDLRARGHRLGLQEGVKYAL